VEKQIANIRACAKMVDIYKLLPGATISTLVVNQNLDNAKWIPRAGDELIRKFNDPDSPSLELKEAFACVAMFESGTCNLDPAGLAEVFAMSSGNSLYVAGSLLCDPHEEPGPSEIRRVVGNIGRAGITFLIPPPDLKQREPNPEKWIAINHYPFDGKAEDHFQETSVHLSFTPYEISLMTEENRRHSIDRSIVLVETLISVYDGESWVGEIDILGAFRSCKDGLGIGRVQCPALEQNHSNINYEESLQKNKRLMATNIENWDELIEAPPRETIAVRAHGNWLARLATMTVCVSHGFTPVILPCQACWMCCAEIIRQQVIIGGNNKIALIC
jgi:hypothetical protein